MANINFHTWQPVKIFVRGANFQQKIKSISYALIRKRKMFPLFVFVALFFFFCLRDCMTTYKKVRAHIHFLFNNFLLKFILLLHFSDFATYQARWGEPKLS